MIVWLAEDFFKAIEKTESKVKICSVKTFVLEVYNEIDSNAQYIIIGSSNDYHLYY
jgi:hypothetical protein